MTTPWMTSDDLIDAVKRKISFPIAQNTFSEDDILAFCNEEMMISQVPSMLQFHEEFFVFTEEVPLVTNKQSYAIPKRAIGMKLRDVFYKDQQGQMYEMTRINPDDKPFFDTSSNNNRSIYRYMFEGNSVVLVANQQAPTGSLVMKYFIRPNKLVRNSHAGYIQSIIDNLNGTTSLVLDQVPSQFLVSSNPIQYGTVDFLQTDGGHKILGINCPILSISNLTVVVSTANIPEELVVGDYLCPQYECIIPQIPDDLHTVLSERTCARILASMGDAAGLKDVNDKIADMEARQGTLIDNRADGSAQKVLARHTHLRLNTWKLRRF